jgi:hypothetical protein
MLPAKKKQKTGEACFSSLQAQGMALSAILPEKSLSALG